MSKFEPRSGYETASTIAAVFPGQGSQGVGMGLDLYLEFPAARAVFDQADKALGFSLSSLCFEGPEEELRQTVNAQPAVLTTSVACWRCLQEMGLARGPLQPAFVAGHSLGEYTSLVAAEVMDFPHALRLVRERGRLMQEAGEKRPGGMAAILGLDKDSVREVCQLTGAEIANMNGAGQIVISGTEQALTQAMEMVKVKGARVIRLAVSGAFHSSLMRRAMWGLVKVLRIAKLHHPRIPIIANTTARPLTHSNSVRAELQNQVCRCVHWEQSVEFMRDAGVNTFVEVGPGEALTGLIKRIDPTATTLSLGDVASLERFAP